MAEAGSHRDGLGLVWVPLATVVVFGCGGGGRAGSVQSGSPNASAVSTQLAVKPTSLSFGNVTVGTHSTLPSTLTNTGGTSVTISQVSITGAGFSISDLGLPLILAARQNASFGVNFAPVAPGSASGSISVVSDAGNYSNIESLSGNGMRPHSVRLSWTASTSSNVAGYNVYRGTVPGGPYTGLNSSLLAATTYTDNTVQPSDTYYYVTTAVNTQGIESAHSAEVRVVIPTS